MISLLMIFLVLMQRPRSEGLGAAFGGGVTDNLFGAQTTNVLQKATVWLGGGFFAVTLLLAIAYSYSNTANRTIRSEVLGDSTNETSAPASAGQEETASTPVSVEETPTANADMIETPSAAVEETIKVLSDAEGTVETVDVQEGVPAAKPQEATPAKSAD